MQRMLLLTHWGVLSHHCHTTGPQSGIKENILSPSQINPCANMWDNVGHWITMELILAWLSWHFHGAERSALMAQLLISKDLKLFCVSVYSKSLSVRTTALALVTGERGEVAGIILQTKYRILRRFFCYGNLNLSPVRNSWVKFIVETEFHYWRLLLLQT